MKVDLKHTCCLIEFRIARVSISATRFTGRIQSRSVRRPAGKIKSNKYDHGDMTRDKCYRHGSVFGHAIRSRVERGVFRSDFEVLARGPRLDVTKHGTAAINRRKRLREQTTSPPPRAINRSRRRRRTQLLGRCPRVAVVRRDTEKITNAASRRPLVGKALPRARRSGDETRDGWARVGTRGCRFRAHRSSRPYRYNFAPGTCVKCHPLPTTNVNL